MSDRLRVVGRSSDDLDARLADALRAGPAVSFENTEPLVEVVRALHNLGVISPIAMEDHLRLLRAACLAPGVVTPSSNWGTRPAPRRAGRIVAGSAAIVLTLGTGVGAAAAASSLPGDWIYRLKTARENVRLTLAGPLGSRATIEVQVARHRLSEATSLIARGNVDLAVATLARADASLDAAGRRGDARIAAQVDAELDRREVVLAALLGRGLPPHATVVIRAQIESARNHPRPTPKPSASPSPRPTPTASPTPSRTGRPSTAPGQSNRPSNKPEQSQRPSTPPGQSNRPTDPPDNDNSPSPSPSRSHSAPSNSGKTNSKSPTPKPSKTRSLSPSPGFSRVGGV